jgi:hypothetical protein
MKQNPVELMKLNSKQIIQQDILDEQKLLEILEFNSFNCLEYGKGTHINYDLPKILESFESLLLAGKATIKWEEEVNFPYTNVGNPFT